jgi:hypothetical protein
VHEAASALHDRAAQTYDEMVERREGSS